MAKKKQAGAERPYTFREFIRMVEGIAKENGVPYLNELDYLLGESDEPKNVMNDPYAEITSLTHWGGSEGIYTGFYIRQYCSEDIHIATAKTLGEKDEDYIAMHTLAGHLCAIANRYIREHSDEFNWSGYDVDFTDTEGLKGGYCLMNYERAWQKALELKAKGYKVTVTNNETRETKEA